MVSRHLSTRWQNCECEINKQPLQWLPNGITKHLLFPDLLPEAAVVTQYMPLSFYDAVLERHGWLDTWDGEGDSLEELLSSIPLITCQPQTCQPLVEFNNMKAEVRGKKEHAMSQAEISQVLSILSQLEGIALCWEELKRVAPHFNLAVSQDSHLTFFLPIQSLWDWQPLPTVWCHDFSSGHDLLNYLTPLC